MARKLIGAMLIVAWVLALGLGSALIYRWLGDTGLWAVVVAMLVAVAAGAYALDRY